MGCAAGAGLGTRVLESLGSGNTSGVAPPSPALNTAVPGPTARVASAGFLSARRDGDCTASLCQCLAALSVRRLFLISSLNLPWHSSCCSLSFLLHSVSVLCQLGQGCDTGASGTVCASQLSLLSPRVPG